MSDEIRLEHKTKRESKEDLLGNTLRFRLYF